MTTVTTNYVYYNLINTIYDVYSENDLYFKDGNKYNLIYENVTIMC